MTPILKYPGAKWRIADWIISHFPPHEGYLEPFFGSGAVFFNKKPSRVETINDLDGNVVRFFRVCREQPDELAGAIEMTPWAREEFYNAISIEAVDDVEFARFFAIRCWMTFGARMRVATGWRHTTGAKKDGGPANPKMWGRLPQVVYEVAGRLKNAQIENRRAIDLLSVYNGPKILIYADPPYVLSTRTLHGDQYRYEMSDADHEAFLRACCAHQGMILISGYDCELYRNILAGWMIDRVHTTAERGAKREECLWINPAAADALRRQSGQLQMEGIKTWR